MQKLLIWTITLFRNQIYLKVFKFKLTFGEILRIYLQYVLSFISVVPLTPLFPNACISMMFQPSIFYQNLVQAKELNLYLHIENIY